MERLNINNILNINELENELEQERASSIYLKLRNLEKKDASYTPIRAHLKELMLKFEQEHWSDESNITDEQVKESDLAEILIEAENNFYSKRKELIKSKLKESGLNQNDLAKILGHRKAYISELINGLRPFSKDDIVIINRLLKIRLEDLVPTFIKQDKAIHIMKTLKSISKSKIKLSKKDFDLQLI